MALVESADKQAVEGIGPEIIISLSPAKAAAALDVDRGTIYKLLNEGKLPSFHIGRARRIPIDALRDFARGNAVYAQ